MSLPRRKDTTNAKRQAAWRRRQAQLQQEALKAKGLPPMPTISNLPGTARWQAQHTLVQTTLETMRDEMQSYFDDRSQGWQEGERGEAMLLRVEALDELIAAVSNLEMT